MIIRIQVVYISLAYKKRRDNEESVWLAKVEVEVEVGWWGGTRKWLDIF